MNRSGWITAGVLAVALTTPLLAGDDLSDAIRKSLGVASKYLVGKQSGIKPDLAQKLSVKPVPNTWLLEARVQAMSREEVARCLEVFVPTLQELCRGQAVVTLEKARQ